MLLLIWKQFDSSHLDDHLDDHLEDGDGDVEPHGVVADEPEEDEEGGLPANWP